jgi:hypothetical protein
MPGRSFTIHFPDGHYEVDAMSQRPPPAVGETIRRAGKLWRITERADGPPVVVRVELAEPDAGLPRGS